MKMIVCIALTVLCAPWAMQAGISHTHDNQQAIAAPHRLRGDTRQFSIQYTGRVSEIPAGAKRLRVWLPAPQNSTVQEISKLEFAPSAKLAFEPKYGNRIAYIEIEHPGTTAEVKMSFVCKRDEIRLNLPNLKEDGKDPANAFAVFKNPDKLVLVNDEMKMLSDRVTLGKSGTLAKAQEIYDYVLEKMTYDKNHVGWGLGSTRHACDVGKGNCTDFHALFNSLCRAQGIASGFEIGLYLPYERNKQETLGGYHCWGFFRVPGKTWVPVDCSEADRFPERKQYFFGNHTSNRVTLSTGRDIDLEPKQEGPPLNYFLNPYAEADGKPVKTEKTWAYQDIGQ
jgi:transglutaminase-like putative cysteine protease